uniref:Uncharacterized protein n=1 Tax=Arundo donax TaxID=35708 RepID=A0A0A9G5K6_ARUDO
MCRQFACLMECTLNISLELGL